MRILSSPRTIGVCGIGQIGLALSLACWRFGYRVLVYGRNREKLDKASQELEKLDAWMSREFPDEKPSYGEIEYTSDLAAIDSKADLIVEGIAEDMASKVTLWQSLPGAADRGAILCSTTSGLSISEMGQRSGFPQQIVGTHFWNPPHLMPLVEVIRGKDTCEEAIQVAVQFCESIGKRPIRVNIDAPGFIGNRMLHALWREAVCIVQRGIASPEDVDAVAKLTFGLRLPALGPLENMDIVGLDLVYTIHQYLLADLAADTEPEALLKEMVEKGFLGIKSGRGFYDWSRRDPLALIQQRDRQIVSELKKLNQSTE